MALQPIVSYKQNCDCETSALTEQTGVYSEFGNPGGYGAPNITSASVTSAVLSIRNSTWGAAIQISFTIASNVITAAVVIDQFGNSRSILDDLLNTQFPLVDQEFNSKILYDTDQIEPLETGAYYCTYTVSDGTSSFSYFFWQFFTCQYEKCIEEVTGKVANGLITENQAIDVFLQADLLTNAVGLSNVDSALSQMRALDVLCASCGCGCCHNSKS